MKGYMKSTQAIHRNTQQKMGRHNFSKNAFLFVTLITWYNAYTQGITLSGKIINPDGKGISNCEVSRAKNITQTDANGKFTLILEPVSAIKTPIYAHKVTLGSQYLELTLTRETPVTISMRNLYGKQVMSIPSTTFKSGIHKINLEKQIKNLNPNSIHLLTVKLGSEISNYRYFSGILKSLENSENIYNPTPLTKTAADVQDLKIHCSGSLPKYIDPGSASASLGDIVIKKANILLLFADDMNAWTSMGNRWAKTPNLDKLAKSGVYFEKAHVIAQECNPSRTATLIGKRPSSTGMYWNDHDFRVPAHSSDKSLSTQITLPQYFKKLGYETLGLGKIFHQPTGSMSDTASWTTQGGGAGTPVPAVYKDSPWHKFDFGDPGKDGAYNDEAFVFGPMEPADPKMSEENTGDYRNATLAAAHIRKSNTKPWFVAYGSFRPHAPLVAPKKYFDMYPLNEIQLPDTFKNDLGDVPTIGKRVALNGGDRNHDVVLKYGVWKQAIQAYKASASFADAQMGRVLSALDSSSEKDNTLVIFLSDHGVHLGEKEHWWKMTLWLQTTHIPFIMRVPGVSVAGGRSKATVDMASLYPTVLDVLRLPPDNLGLDGKSLSPLLQNPNTNWETPAITTAGYKNHSVVTSDWRYIQYSDGGEELYDLKSDSLEFNNLIWTAEGKTKYTSVTDKLKSFLPKTNLKDLLN